jgi:hypothetical protein
VAVLVVLLILFPPMEVQAVVLVKQVIQRALLLVQILMLVVHQEVAIK